ncbi:hypothetical protein [Colwellia sp. PAMC 21821]|uniref:hypothetical protein n=1 Tax=Colwellia sp. PAMC 21821 TaxID=1816219 RepID=UPI0009BFC6CC|nr:hypothetical protein [Colwellia sp. PAMC 21821]ARD44445.1 hypothetical protein A3Q33_09080 [Colwellia sp. PAMC 21821]
MSDNPVQASIVTPIPAAAVEPPKQLTLTQRIDADEGLKAKRKLLTVVSLILLAITFSGAKVVDANTFIMKISFTNQSGIAYLLLLSIAFLMIRYYNYARPYHDELYKTWTERMLNDRYFYLYHDEANESEGLITKLYPENLIKDIDQQDCRGIKTKYRCSAFFGRNLEYTWFSGDGPGYESWATVNLMRIKSDEIKKKDKQEDKKVTKNRVNLKPYFKVLSYELRYRAARFFTHRENLDIISPYFLGCFSILSFIFNKEIIEILKGFSS